jgi:hypothetical protein
MDQPLAVSAADPAATVAGGPLIGDAIGAAREAVAEARRTVAVAQAKLAAAGVHYADLRTAAERASDLVASPTGARRPSPGEFVADELSPVLREQPWQVRCLLARTRRLRTDLPTVWQAFQAGDLDAEQVRVIDKAARRVTEAHTLAVLDDQVVDAAQTRTPKQLSCWLLRLIVRLEPLAFAKRHRRALADRRVTVVQGVDGIGYVTGEMTAADAAAIDALLTSAARSLGASDPRTEQQRRADLLTDILLGRLRFDDDPDHQNVDDRAPDQETASGEEPTESARPGASAEREDASTERRADASGDSNDDESGEREVGGSGDWLEVEEVDAETGELLGTSRLALNADGTAIGNPQPISSVGLVRRPRTVRIGVVVPLSSLLGLNETAGELTDRSGCVPADHLRQLIADSLTYSSIAARSDEVLFTRLLTDDGGRLLDTTELGRYPSKRLAEAIRIRAGTCKHPTCTVPADRCDIDHHEPQPRGPTAGSNLDPGCRRHHRGKTFAWHATVRDSDGVDWTMPDDTRYRCTDDPLPTGLDTARVMGHTATAMSPQMSSR